jgi:hypothetical protein
VRHILWGVPYPTLLMMMNDAPHYVSADELKKRIRKTLRANKKADPGLPALKFFQTKLNDPKCPR